ncbi:hypothetical protein BUALT_Bualt09G0071500 [Buddleja alternifolia]|uniref:Maturase K n=1 Tax=Buddleja alternifolia TaxID=168488 RepID=A0AAV6X7Y8_9LAMI|nr:hypothetical protein BUALT_Bualt09G0071500 [Buddleja alternifolia]
MQEDWYSDAAEDDDLISLDESENENEDKGEQRRRHAYFREGDWNMKGKTLLKGMKFQNFKVYIKALRDYYVRMGVDLHFIRNEASRITARKPAGAITSTVTPDVPKSSEKSTEKSANYQSPNSIEVIADQMEEKMEAIVDGSTEFGAAQLESEFTAPGEVKGTKTQEETTNQNPAIMPVQKWSKLFIG